MKVILIGDTSVGKTSIIERMIKDVFNPSEIRATTSFAISTYKGPDPEDPEVQIWDTAGMEKYRSVNRTYYRDAAAALLVFDLSNRLSFENAKGVWKTDFESCCPGNTFMFLIGNKCDLADAIEVTEEEARNWANGNNINYFETSAMTGEGVSEMRTALMKMLPRCQNITYDVPVREQKRRFCC